MRVFCWPAFVHVVFFIILSHVETVAASNNTTTATSCQKQVNNRCPMSLKIDWWEIPPYIYKDPNNGVSGIFPDILKDLVRQCCDSEDNSNSDANVPSCVHLNYSEVPSNDSEVVKKQIDKNGTLISMPIYGDMKDVTFQNHPFYPVVESPGVVFIVKKEDSSNAAQAVMEAVFQGWPVLLLTLIMAALSGIVVWALDTYWNPEEFPRSFFKGTWEGFWWAFVSMTTVGYGDRAPRSVLARTFAFIWVLIGLVIISIFTATVTTSLTAISLSNEIKLYGSDVVALKNTEEQRLGVRNNAKVSELNSVSELKDAVIKQDPKVTGALLDSYVAGYWAKVAENPVLKNPDLRVGTVLDHQFAYGFVIAGALKNAEKCIRKKLNSMETKITQIIQKQAKTMEEPGESAAVEKTNNLFDAESPMFRKAIYTCIGLVGALTICGLIWEFLYWRPRQPKEAKTEVERIVTPETSYENLVAMQCAEIEEAMMNEVQRFYVAWNKKLEELKRRNGQSPSDVNIIGMGVSGGDMRSL
ncbi:uncharacterized protein LOC111330919 [Stylophora pistillata]|uniref:Potassium voltage-gated channel subfamily F member 1 n=1 Tax=Stylophora pistillata TaxID=50429 RepID=A0A2B4S8T5_STYPI|nr:uncharacterized protein LOC111330919 [Stylophora pistillata]PFX25007.1 Potassium voltage-gated channel subfamily F member 1 [Stylophora pistillata]